MESGIICRWKYQGIIIDIMPTDDESIGFKNIWYPLAFKTAIELSLDERTTVKIPTASCFLSTKFEAFKSRGNYDGYRSHDFEDIIFILQTRSTIWKEIEEAPQELKRYLMDAFQKLIQQKLVRDWIEGNVDKIL